MSNEEVGTPMTPMTPPNRRILLQLSVEIDQAEDEPIEVPVALLQLEHAGIAHLAAFVSGPQPTNTGAVVVAMLNELLSRVAPRPAKAPASAEPVAEDPEPS